MLKQKLHHSRICKQYRRHQSRGSFDACEGGAHAILQQPLDVADSAALDRGEERVARVVVLSGSRRKTGHKEAQKTQKHFVNLVHFCGYFPALHKKSWAVIDRPYSLGCATVGALYERPRCIFCAKPHKPKPTKSTKRVFLEPFVVRSFFVGKA